MSWSKRSRQARGYDAKWERTRLLVLRRDNGLCQCDRCKGGELRLTPATEVHHVTSKARAKALGWTRAQTDDPSNLASMSHECHLLADAEAQGRTLKQGCDLNGMPLDPKHAWNKGRGAAIAPDRQAKDRAPSLAQSRLYFAGKRKCA